MVTQDMINLCQGISPIFTLAIVTNAEMFVGVNAVEGKMFVGFWDSLSRSPDRCREQTVNSDQRAILNKSAAIQPAIYRL